MMLTVSDKRVLSVFHEEGFQLRVSSQCRERKENAILLPYLLETIQYTNGKSVMKDVEQTESYNGACFAIYERKVYHKRDAHDEVIKWKLVRITGPVCGEFTGHRRIPRTKGQ